MVDVNQTTVVTMFYEQTSRGGAQLDALSSVHQVRPQIEVGTPSQLIV